MRAIVSASSPVSGSRSSFAVSASARKAESRTIRSKARRRTARRSDGTPGGAAKGCPSVFGAPTNSKHAPLLLVLRVVGEQCDVRQRDVLLKTDLCDRNDLPSPDPFGARRLEA